MYGTRAPQGTVTRTNKGKHARHQGCLLCGFHCYRAERGVGARDVASRHSRPAPVTNLQAARNDRLSRVPAARTQSVRHKTTHMRARAADASAPVRGQRVCGAARCRCVQHHCLMPQHQQRTRLHRVLQQPPARRGVEWQRAPRDARRRHHRPHRLQHDIAEICSPGLCGSRAWYSSCSAWRCCSGCCSDDTPRF